MSSPLESPAANQTPDATAQPGRLPQSTEFLLRLIEVASQIQAMPDAKERLLAIVNRTATLFPYERGLLVRLTPRAKLLAAKGVAQADQKQPLIVQRLRLMRAIKKSSVGVVVAEDFPESERAAFLTLNQDVSVIWLPLLAHGGITPSHGLWLERAGRNSWQKRDEILLEPLAAFYAQALKWSWQPPVKLHHLLLASLVLIALGFLPVPAKTVSPGYVKAQNPLYMTASLDGIVAELKVKSGQQVVRGAPLLTFDRRALEREIDEAAAQVEAASAELLRLRNISFDDPEARANMQLQEVEIRRRQVRLDFLTVQRAHLELFAPANGVAQVEDEDHLVGKPVKTGQRLVVIGNPAHTEWQAHLAVEDVGYIQRGQKVRVYLDHNPLTAIEGVVRQMDFEITLSPDNVPSVRVYVQWQNKNLHVPPGAHGVMHAEGGKLPFWYAVLRKPLSKLNAKVGIW